MSVPRLRFDGFVEEWPNRPVSEIVGRLVSGVSVNSEDEPISTSNEYGILKTSCIANGYFFEQENKKIIPTEIIRAKLNPVEDSILVSRMNTPQLVGEVGYVSKNYPNLFVPDRLWLIEINDKSRDVTKWLSQQLTTEKLKNILSSIATGTSGSMKNIAQPNFLSIELSTPEFAEQTKIANFLTAVDEKITHLTQKHTLLTQYKKGVMQQIFSQQLRFKDDDGRDYPEWEEKRLGEISNIKRGASPRPISDKKWFSSKSTIGWVRISDVSSSNKYLNFTDQYLSEAGINKSRLVKQGNIIMSICATIGKPIYTNFDVCIHDGFVVFEDLQINHEYLYYFLMLIEKKWYQYGQPGSQVNLNSDIVSNEAILIPSSAEQTKIANFLTAIDDKLATVQTQLNAMKQYKQGLLQQMFV